MLNLLPPDTKRQIRAGKSNVLLLRYCIVSLVLGALLFAMVVVVYVVMNSSKKAAETVIEESNAKSLAYQEIKQNATEFNNNLSIAKTILDKEVKYSEIAIKMAQNIPQGIVLTSLHLDAKTFGTPDSLVAMGKSYNDAIRLKTALENSKMFKDVHLEEVSIMSEPKGEYNTMIQISVTIDPEEAKA